MSAQPLRDSSGNLIEFDEVDLEEENYVPDEGMIAEQLAADLMCNEDVDVLPFAQCVIRILKDDPFY